MCSRALVLSCFALLLAAPAWCETNLIPSEQRTIQLFRAASPSVVHIAVERPSPNQNQPPEGEYGTGLIWDQQGHIVTNAHVVKNASAIAVVLASGELRAARLVGSAPYYDLAVLRMGDPQRTPPQLSIGDSSRIQVGQLVLAIGNPFGFDQTLTAGIVSALKRRVVVDGTHEIPNAIQTDAAINPGNSGGPLLNSSGEMIGINTSILSSSGTSSGIGFAIPVETVKRVVSELIQTGHASFPGVGVVIAPHSISVAEGIKGLTIARVLPGTPADRAGLQGRDGIHRGDVIIEANGVQTRTLADLTNEIARTGVGESVSLMIHHGGRTHLVSLRVIDETSYDEIHASARIRPLCSSLGDVSGAGCSSALVLPAPDSALSSLLAATMNQKSSLRKIPQSVSRALTANTSKHMTWIDRGSVILLRPVQHF